jgi:hypothetical protein
MEEEHKALRALYLRYLDGKCNEEELQKLLIHFEEEGQNSPLMDSIGEMFEHMPEEAISALHPRTERIIADTDQFIPTIVLPENRTTHP